MITPRFELSQTERSLTITIRAPYCSLKELEVDVDDSAFLFYCKPYYLRLNLPGKIEENINTSSSFDADSGIFTFTYDKTNAGETFENLQFITKFLTPKVEVHEEQAPHRKIEVLTSSGGDDDVQNGDIVESEEQYGFAQRGGYNFNFISSEFSEIFELNPHEVKLSDRTKLRIANEQKNFNFDHYLADYIDSDEIDSLIKQTAPWAAIANQKECKFNGEELDFLKDLPNLKFELSERQIKFAMTSLLDIIFSYCYDRRTTCFEGNCESGWAILKVSATLSTFDGFQSPKDALIAGFRRSLIFPLYRNFALGEKVLDDLKDLLRLGTYQILKALIEIHRIFVGGSAPRYILNHLFIKDYIIYAQSWPKDLWQSMVDEVLDMVITKDDLGLPLESIETDLCQSNSDSDDSSESDTDSDSESDSETDSDESEESSAVSTPESPKGAKIEEDLTTQLQTLTLQADESTNSTKIVTTTKTKAELDELDSDDESDDNEAARIVDK